MTLDQVRKMADFLELTLDIWSPGDKRRRFKFTTRNRRASRTIKGIKEAQLYLDGYADALTQVELPLKIVEAVPA